MATKKKAASSAATLQKAADKILQEAEAKGVATNYFFRTTFDRYQVQLKILSDLEQTIKSDGALVTKEYVKGRENIYTHPAITEYNRTATAANGTVITLTKIVSGFESTESKQGPQSRLDKLLTAMSD